MVEKGTPDPVDLHVGRKVSERRVRLGLSQADLGGKVGVSFQQIQKYESGANRISASRLYKIAVSLRTHLSYFFDGLPPPEQGEPSSRRGGRAKSKQRLRIEALARAPIGTKTTFSYGSFPTSKSAQNMVNMVGRSGWATVNVGIRGTTIRKVAEP